MGTTEKYTPTKMKKVFKRKWLKALRSGEFEQGEGYLEQTDPDVDDNGKMKTQYCCLGVAKKIFGLRAKRTCQILSDGACKKIGLDPKIQNTLATFNDTEQWSFTKIANWIEKHL